MKFTSSWPLGCSAERQAASPLAGLGVASPADGLALDQVELQDDRRRHLCPRSGRGRAAMLPSSAEKCRPCSQ